MFKKFFPIMCLFFFNEMLLSAEGIKPKEEMAEEGYTSDSAKELNFSLLWDYHLSPYVGSHLMRSMTEIYEALLPHKAKGNSLGSSLLRSGHSLLDIFFYYHSALVQHEIFGHGARFREFGAKNITYQLGFFNGEVNADKVLYSQQKTLISSGGIEAADIMAHEVELGFLESSSVSPDKAWNYFFAFANQSFYIHLFPGGATSAHDIILYLSNLNLYYNSSHVVSHKHLRFLGLFDYFNPFIYYSLYSIGNYIATGENSFEYPMIKLTDNLSYLPATRLVLTPYGPEVHLLNYLRYKTISAKVSLGYGNTAGASSFFLGAFLNSVPVSDRFVLGGQVAFWTQPQITLANSSEGSDSTPGFLFILKPSVRLINKFFLDGQLGYKTRGFVQGEAIKATFIGRVGLKLLL